MHAYACIDSSVIIQGALSVVISSAAAHVPGNRVAMVDGSQFCCDLCKSYISTQVLIMGGADNDGNGLAYSQRLTGMAPGQTAEWQQEAMGLKRIEGVGVLLPDGTVFLCSGASYG